MPVVAIVNETFARTYYPGREAVGQRVQTVDEPEAEVIGLVRDHRIGTIGEAPASVVYYAYAQRPSELILHVRTAPAPEHRWQPCAGPSTKSMVPSRSACRRCAARPASSSPCDERNISHGIMGGVGSLLAVIGLYGVMAYVAAARTAEVGIRMALGASSQRIRREMLRRALRIVAPGIGLGMMASLLMMPAFSTFLAGVSPFDPVALAAEPRSCC